MLTTELHAFPSEKPEQTLTAGQCSGLRDLVSASFHQIRSIIIISGRNHTHWLNMQLQFSVVQFSCSIVSDSLQHHGLHHVRPPCPSPNPGLYSNSCPLSQWYHQTISSSVVPSPPALNLSQHQSLFQWVSSVHQLAKVLEFQYFSFSWFSTSVLPMNTQDWCL